MPLRDLVLIQSCFTHNEFPPSVSYKNYGSFVKVYLHLIGETLPSLSEYLSNRNGG